MRTIATARLKRTRAVELVAQGMSYEEVARAVGYGHRGRAHRALSRTLSDREVEGVDELRAVELARLDRLQVSIWEQAVGGDVRAVAAVVRIIELRVRLLGLGQRGPRHDEPDQVLVVGAPEGNVEGNM